MPAGRISHFRVSSHEPAVDRAGSVAGTNFALRAYEKFQLGFRNKKRPKILGTSSGAKFEKQSKHGEKTKFITFAPIIASATLKAAFLLLNGMLMMMKIQRAMQDDAIRTARVIPLSSR